MRRNAAVAVIRVYPTRAASQETENYRRPSEKIRKVEPIIGMEDPYYYRNKVHAAFGRDRKGNVISGIYEEKSHRIVSVDDCMIEDKKVRKSSVPYVVC